MIQLSCIQVPVQEMSEIQTIHQQEPHKTTEHKCEQVTKHELVIILEQKQPPKNAIVYGSSVDIKYINFRGANLRLPPVILHPNSLLHL